jgi:hypothetical protein
MLPSSLTRAIDEVLEQADVPHIAHGDRDPVRAAMTAAEDRDALAVIGPFRSRDIVEAVEVTAEAGLAMIVPVATWVGVTRDDEPGSEDDPARHHGTIFRMVARDSVVARSIVDFVRASTRRAFVIAGDHEYGAQLDRQLTAAGLPRSANAHDAQVIVLAGLAGHPEADQARALAPLPIVVFDGIQGERFPGQDAVMALAYAKSDEGLGVPEARRAARLIVGAIGLNRDTGAIDRREVLQRIRELGPFDEHGDLIHAPVTFEPIV